MGNLCSLFLITIMALYGLIKLDHLLNKQNPSITTLEEHKEFEDEINPINLRDDANMRFAYSILDAQEEESLLDTRYVKIIPRIWTTFANGTQTERVLDHHPCTDDDWAQFSPPDDSAEVFFRKIKNSKKHTFICFDWERDGNSLDIGIDNKGSVQRLEFNVTPCNYIHNYLGYEKDKIKDDCIANEAAQREYLDNFKIFLYASDAEFDQQ